MLSSRGGTDIPHSVKQILSRMYTRRGALSGEAHTTLVFLLIDSGLMSPAVLSWLDFVSKDSILGFVRV